MVVSLKQIYPLPGRVLLPTRRRGLQMVETYCVTCKHRTGTTSACSLVVWTARQDRCLSDLVSMVFRYSLPTDDGWPMFPMNLGTWRSMSHGSQDLVIRSQFRPVAGLVRDGRETVANYFTGKAMR